MNLPTLALCMIVKNEASDLPRCLDSVTPVVDEIVVVDTGSADGTIAIARRHNARVFQHQWQNDFAQARNFSLQYAQSDWILVLDADEELDSDARETISALIRNPSADGYRLRQRNFLPQDELQYYTDLWLTRLFRNRPDYRFEYAIHEEVRPSIVRAGGKVENSELIIRHYGYSRKTAQRDNSRAARNLQIVRQLLAQTPDDAYLTYHLGATYKALEQTEEAWRALQLVLTLDYRPLGNEVLEQLFLKLAQLALQKDLLQEASVYAERCLEYNSQNITAMYVLALALFYTRNIKGAYRHFQQIRQSPYTNAAHYSSLDEILAYCLNPH